MYYLNLVGHWSLRFVIFKLFLFCHFSSCTHGLSLSSKGPSVCFCPLASRRQSFGMTTASVCFNILQPFDVSGHFSFQISFNLKLFDFLPDGVFLQNTD